MDISKEQLLSRVQLMSRSNAIENRHDPGAVEHHLMVTNKLKDLIDQGDIRSYLELESTYTFLLDKLAEDDEKIDEYVKEIRNFIL